MERQIEIETFVPQEYWSITATLEADVPPPFDAKLVEDNGSKADIADGKAAASVLDGVPASASKILLVRPERLLNMIVQQHLAGRPDPVLQDLTFPSVRPAVVYTMETDRDLAIHVDVRDVPKLIQPVIERVLHRLGPMTQPAG